MRSVEYVTRKEPHPSLCEHWMPDDGTHELSNSCWCGPIIENHDGPGSGQAKTICRHRPTQRPGAA
jgi:hypothetical protein